MSWLVLLVSGAFEAVWAIALSKSAGFSRPLPTLVFAVALAASMAGLGYALRDLPVGTAYAVWVGVGASLAVVWSIATGQEVFSVAKAVCLMAIVGGVVGLKVLH